MPASCFSFRASLLACAGLAATTCAQISTFTGGSPIDPVNWCDPLNWFPADIPADGNTINVPGGELANMAGCSGSLMRILGPINASGTIRFYTPVTFAGGGTVNNPVFEFSTTPVPVGGALAITGPNAIWQGGIFSGGALHNSGSLLVERSFISGRTSPRELINGCEFTNAGTMRLRQGIKINDTSILRNEGVLSCEVSTSIGRDNGSGMIDNDGQINVPAGLSLSLACGLFSNAELYSEGVLTMQAEATVQNRMVVDEGGTIRFQAFQNQPVVLGPGQFSGEGSVQLSNGLFQLGNVNTSVTGPNGRGLLFATTGPIDVSNARIVVFGSDSTNPGLLTWSAGTINGMDGNRSPAHIEIHDAGLLNIVSTPGFGGGGDALGVHFEVDGAVYQSATARLLSGSRMMVSLLGMYVLSHTRLDGDGTTLLEVDGRLEVNPPFDASSATAFLNAVNTNLRANSVTVVHRNDFITSSSPINISDNSLVYVEQGARWRALGPTSTSGTPRFTGGGIFELGAGQFLTVQGELTLDTAHDPAFGFKQFGTVRGLEASAHIENNGAWEWRSGAIDIPQGSLTNNGLLIADCGTCQLRSEVFNNDLLRVLDTLMLAVPGVEVHNNNLIELRGSINDATNAHEGLLHNSFGGEIVKLGTTFSQIGTTFDNFGTLRVAEGTLTLVSPILQYANGTLTGGTWIVQSGATLSTPGLAINVVDADVTIEYGGTWPQFLPRENHGAISISRPLTLPGFVNLSDVDIILRGSVGLTLTTDYRQLAGRTTVHAGAELSSQLPILINGGVLGGTGTIAAPVVNSGGTVSPGLSPGTLTINGPFDQSQGAGSLEIEIAGASPAQHDLLVVSGAATLGGTLRILLLDSFIPSVGDTFTILTAPSIQGEFAVLVPPASGLPSGAKLSLVRTATSISLRVSCSADFNGDSAVDFFDYLDFVQAFAENSIAADFNDDSIVDFFDYLDFVSAFSGGC